MKYILIESKFPFGPAALGKKKKKKKRPDSLYSLEKMPEPFALNHAPLAWLVSA